jgi:CHAT domain-containing protein
VNQRSEHLSDAQIEQYGKRASGAGPETEAWVETHLDDCSSCRSRVLEFQRTQFALLPDPKVNTVSSSNCPSEEDLRTLAAGLCSNPLAAELTAHAVACGHCGPLLREYQEDFSDDVTPEEQTALAQLRSASPEWQQQKAREMLQRVTPQPLPATSRKPWIFAWKWLTAPAAVAAACVLLALGIGGVTWYARRDTQGKVEALLAQAATEKRIMDIRWPGAKWAQPQVILGNGEESAFAKSEALFEAEKIIRKRTVNPNDLDWLRLRAEAEILENKPGAAIELLTPASHAESVPVPLMLDLAMAHSQQFLKSHDSRDSVTTINLLTQVLKREPQNRTALFNLAVAYANAGFWDQAASAWDGYLRADPAGDWAEEAKRNRDVARSKIHFGLQQLPRLPTGAALFLDLKDDQAVFRLEQYQDIAMRYWLAKAVADPQSPEHRAFSRLGKMFDRVSSDAWLNDFLQAASGHDSAGAEALSGAFTDSAKEHYKPALKKSRRATKIFVRQRNFTGALLARYETVYARRRLLKGRDCLNRATALHAQILGTRYRWLQSQVGMEMAICLNYVEKIPESDAALLESFRIAEKSRFPILLLRNVGFAQGLHNQQHKFDLAWQEGIQGLAGYWDGPPSVERIYQFYAGFSRGAQAMGLWAASEAFMRHAIDILQTEDDDIQRGAALLELSNLLVAEKDDATAESVALDANLLFDRESQEPTSRIYRLNGKLELAELQLHRGKPQEALATLEPARELLSKTDGYFVSLNFHRLSGNVNLALRRLDAASSEYKAAILIAEQALAELKTDRERLQWITTTDEAYRGLVRILIEQHDQENAWKLWEWYASRSYSANSGNARLPAVWDDIWTKIVSVLQPTQGPVRLVYAVFDDGIQVWTLTSGHMEAKWVSSARDDLERTVRDFSQACSHKDSPLQQVQELGQKLFTLLLQPVAEKLLSGQVIAVELDRPLSGLAMEALRSPNGWYFGEKYPVVYSAGIVYEQSLRRQSTLSPQLPLLLVDAAANGYFPGHEKELAAIQQAFPHNFPGSTADSAAGVLARLSQSAVLSFMGHGEPYETGTGLRVDPKLVLTAKDFTPRNLRHLRLAVLAACSTGSSGADGLLDNRSLVHAFLSGGVPSVVASRWNVESESTADLMSDFYHDVPKEPPAQALFSARNQLLKTYSHPYYWAGFSVTGKTN